MKAVTQGLVEIKKAKNKVLNVKKKLGIKA